MVGPSYGNTGPASAKLELPDTNEKFTTLEGKINSKFDRVSSLITTGQFSDAIRDAKDMRNQLREILFEEPRATSQVIKIKINKNINEKELKTIAINHMGGNFIDVLNLYKRVEMFYTYALIKRFTSGGKQLLEEDKKLITKTLSDVFDFKIEIISTKNNESFVVYESFLVDIHENYLFNREISSYFSDLQISEGLEEVKYRINQNRNQTMHAECERKYLVKYPDASPNWATDFCKHISSKNTECAIDEVAKIEMGKFSCDYRGDKLLHYRGELRGVERYKNLGEECFQTSDSKIDTILKYSFKFAPHINKYCNTVNR